MPLIIVAARNIKEANDNSSYKESYVVEDIGLQDFFFIYRNEFKHYYIYHKLNPAGISKVDKTEVVLIKEFAESVRYFIENKVDNNFELENRIIDQCNVSITKVKRYIARLLKVVDYAMKNNDDIFGLGD